MLIDKVVDLGKLQTELNNAGIAVTALGQTENNLHTYDADGAPLDLPESAKAVIDAHDPAPDLKILIKQSLADTDAGMARIAEDIIDVLVANGFVFPQMVIDKIVERKELRAQLTTPVEEPTT